MLMRATILLSTLKIYIFARFFNSCLQFIDIHLCIVILLSNDRRSFGYCFKKPSLVDISPFFIAREFASNGWSELELSVLNSA